MRCANTDCVSMLVQDKFFSWKHTPPKSKTKWSMHLPACDNYTTSCVCAAGKTLRNLRTSKRCKARSFDSDSLARGHSESQVSRNNPGNPLSISTCLPSFNISNSLYQYQLLTNSSNSNNIPKLHNNEVFIAVQEWLSGWRVNIFKVTNQIDEWTCTEAYLYICKYTSSIHIMPCRCT